MSKLDEIEARAAGTPRQCTWPAHQGRECVVVPDPPSPTDIAYLLRVARAAERLVMSEADPDGDIDSATAAFLDMRAALEGREP